jgi:hypothetical protein
MYLELASTWKGNGLWLNYSTRNDGFGNVRQLSEDEMQLIMECEQNKFHGFCLVMTSFVSNNRNQLFYHTLALKFHGLSRMGNHILSQIGFSMKPSSFDSAQKTMLEEARSQIWFIFSLLCVLCYPY